MKRGGVDGQRDDGPGYTEIRQDRTVRAPDAFQLGCAGAARVDLFITSDDQLSRCTVPGVQFIASRVPLTATCRPPAAGSAR